MKVKDSMTSPVQVCGPDTNLAAVATQLWDSDCGVLPVLDHEGKVIGMITDRDICMAVSTKNRLASEITVWETISGNAYACGPTNDVKDAMKTMASKRIHRMPVVDESGILKGILCLNDLILHAEKAEGGKRSDISYDDVMRTLKAISAHRVLAAA